MSSRASSTLPLLLGHTLRVSADVSLPSNCFTVVVPRSVAGEAGKRFDSVFQSSTNVSQARKHNVRHCDGRSWHLVYALHRVRLT